MIVDAVRNNTLAIGIFALVCGAILAGTYQLTKQPIADAERAAAEKALLEIVPASRHNNDLLLDTVPVPEQYWKTLGLKQGGDIHVARDGGKPVAIIVPSVTQEGYNGEIRLIVGINFDGTIAGVRAVKHGETPGLGDKVDLRKSDWILEFNNTSLQNPAIAGWAVKKDGGEFDQFTGATITPRAIVKQVLKTLQYFADDQQRLNSLIEESTP